jgi:ABC-type transporter Mla maintaining outer membrane lipid asymmetry ATPase subunit MlaF
VDWPIEPSPAINNSGPLARAIAYQPAVFLFDEPLSNLDARLRLEASTFLNRLPRELSVTTVFVTHDQAEEWSPSVGATSTHTAATLCPERRRPGS